MTGRWCRGLARLRGAESGASAVEFALLVPVMLLILVAILDFGSNILMRLSLTQSLSSATNYALVSSDDVSASGGEALAGRIGSLVPVDKDVQISINNGPSYTRSSGVASTGGVTNNADKCWCPTGTAETLNWGSATSCGAACPDGSPAGKYVVITTSQVYTPIFLTYGVVSPGPVVLRAMVQVK
ncbi:TadE/TadG family type IV pilus assembly protein [Devosia sp.]|uniref:TadE/TadG family type IV pilus assembly protein n=1 Tax=Devosia sp. TaxID=1871048 RepID=UPI003A8D1BD1